MDFTGRFVSVNKDWQSDEWRITFTVNEEQAITRNVNMIKDCDKLAITAKKYRQKRSKDANAYAWVLMQKIAEAVHSDKWSVYLDCLKKYSRSFTHVIVKPEAVESMKELYRECVDLGEITVNGQSGHQLQVYFGSSTFDTKEMSVFIDGIVSECEQLDIETMTPAEIERLKNSWMANGGK